MTTIKSHRFEPSADKIEAGERINFCSGKRSSEYLQAFTFQMMNMNIHFGSWFQGSLSGNWDEEEEDEEEEEIEIHLACIASAPSSSSSHPFLFSSHSPQLMVLFLEFTLSLFAWRRCSIHSLLRLRETERKTWKWIVLFRDKIS